MNCPYCGRAAVLEDSAKIYGKSYGLFWICRGFPECDAYVGTHKNSRAHAPLGRMANGKLREWKVKAHDAFDGWWKREGVDRYRAYGELAERMGIPRKDAHIGKFGVEQCRKVVEMFAGQFILDALPRKK